MKILTLIIGDVLLFYAALWAALGLRYRNGSVEDALQQHLLPFTVVFFLWTLTFGSFRLYDFRFIKNNKEFLYRLFQAVALNTVLAVLVFYLIPLWGIEPRRNLLIIVLFSIFALSLWRYGFNLLIVKAPATRVIFFGINPDTVHLVDYLLKNPQLGHRPVGFIANRATGSETLPIPQFVFDEKSFPHIIRDTGADIIVIAPEMKGNKMLVNVLFQVLPLGISVVEFPAFHEKIAGKVPLSLIAEVWFLENLIGAKPRYDFFKRILDLMLACIFGVIVVLLLPFVAAANFISHPRDVLEYKAKRARPGDGIVFFRQTRVGQNGQLFNFAKFRSQVLGSEKMGEAKQLANDPRQYPVGQVLRKTYIDEFAQVWNVLRGEMSFVGPRPERPEYVEDLKKKVPFYEMRLLVKPGITGWAQVNMENDASVEDAPEKMQYDLYYIKHRGVALDLLILMRTVFSILGRTGR